MDGAPVDVVPINSEGVVEQLGVADGLGDVEGLLLPWWPHVQPATEASRPLL